MLHGRFHDLLSDPSVWLWLGGAIAAVCLLATSVNRRQNRLVEALRAFVKRQLPPTDESEKPDN